MTGPNPFTAGPGELPGDLPDDHPYNDPVAYQERLAEEEAEMEAANSYGNPAAEGAAAARRERGTEWTRDAIDYVLDELEAGGVGAEISAERPAELDAIRAGRFLEVLRAKEKELAAVSEWYLERNAALKRGIEWLRAQLEAYARIEFARTGLRTFPVGRGSASIRKAVAVVRWDESAARPWLLELAREFPAVIKSFHHRHALGHVAFDNVVRGDGTVEAVDPRTGEILAGLVRDTRPGQVTVSVKIGEEGDADDRSAAC